MIKVSPISYSTNKMSSSVNIQKILFKGQPDSFEIQSEKKDKIAKMYFDSIINPDLDDIHKDIEDVSDSSMRCYYTGERSGFHTFHQNKENYLEFEIKRNGLRKYIVIKAFEGNTLKKEIEVYPNKSVKTKIFKQNPSEYDLYGVDFVSDIKEYYQGVQEKNNGSNATISVDRKFIFKGDTLERYEEGCTFSNDKKSDAIKIQKRFEPNYDYNFVDYREGISQKNSFSKENIKYSSCFTFRGF